MTRDRIYKIIEKIGIYDLQEYSDRRPLIADGATITFEESEGGSEGSGEEWWMVLKVVDETGESFWEIPGAYYSNYGIEAEKSNIYQVKSVPKTIQVWVAV